MSSGRRYKQGRAGNRIHIAAGGGRRKTNETGDVRIGSLGVPPEISRSGIHQDIPVRQPDGVSAQYSSAGGAKRGSADGANGEKLGRNRGAEANRPVEVGRVDEQHQPMRQRDNLRRDNLHTVNHKEQVNTEDEKSRSQKSDFCFLKWVAMRPCSSKI